MSFIFERCGHCNRVTTEELEPRAWGDHWRRCCSFCREAYDAGVRSRTKVSEPDPAEGGNETDPK